MGVLGFIYDVLDLVLTFLFWRGEWQRRHSPVAAWMIIGAFGVLILLSVVFGPAVWQAVREQWLARK
jgi:hypothetical protein